MRCQKTNIQVETLLLRQHYQSVSPVQERPPALEPRNPCCRPLHRRVMRCITPQPAPVEVAQDAQRVLQSDACRHNPQDPEVRPQQSKQVWAWVVSAPAHAGYGRVALPTSARFLHVTVGIEAVEPGQAACGRDTQQQSTARTQDTSGLRERLFLFHGEGQLIQQHDSIEVCIGEGPLDDRRRERDTSQLGQWTHIERMTGHGEPGPLQVTSHGIVATKEQHSSARRQALCQWEAWDGHAVNHAGYDREQECQEPT